MTLLITLKMPVFAPIPRASAATATAVKPGLFLSMRSDCLISAKRDSMLQITNGQP